MGKKEKKEEIEIILKKKENDSMRITKKGK